MNENIANFDDKPDLICLSESGVKSDALLGNLELKGYDLLFTNPRKTAEGVGVYISKNLNYRFVKHNWLGIEECENILVER